jgi:thiol:disulfide interchange protein DsbD
MLRKSAFLICFFIQFSVAQAQIFVPVTWEFRHEKTGENRFDIVMTAIIETGSHIYGMEVPEGGPIPTTFSFAAPDGYKIEGTVHEVTPAVEKMDEAFGFEIKTYSNRAEFRQTITGIVSAFTVNGVVNFMACNDMTCSPPKDVEFSIKITDNKPSKKEGLMVFFLLSLLAGLAGALTPCVFPMIPMTVAFFSRGSENKSRSVINALIFGLSIILIYSSLGIIVSLTSAGAGFANSLSVHWLPNIIFFALFVIFAASFFGAFDIVLPNKWVSKADSKVDRGGVFASFFMGLTTVIVSFSCTGPIVGALLVEAATGNVLRPTVGMAGFGIAFALPFTVFALFPSMMSKLPKSGGWLNSVKVFLGFIMLAFSMKFLMTIDSVYNLKLISRDIFLAIWIVLFTLSGFYLLGKIKFKHDSDLPYISFFRLIISTAVFSFVICLMLGLLGAPLKPLASLLPPQSTSQINMPLLMLQNRNGVAISERQSQLIGLCSEPKYENIFDMPYGLSGYFDLNQGLACAKEQEKPALIYFKGHACANCKIMEAEVWSDFEVLKRLRDNFVIIALYVDDKTQLPENEWVISKIDGKTKKTIGQLNEDIEISMFKTNALPLYVITDYEGVTLNKPMPTNRDIDEYKQWLDDVLNKFNLK